MKNYNESFWLDVDGKHIWCRHDCTNGTVTDILPYGSITGWTSTPEGAITPSVHCHSCHMHVMGKIGPVPADWVQP